MRSLLEDVSRVELEARLQELTRIESAILRSQETERAMRAQNFSDLAGERHSDRLNIGPLCEWMAWERRVYEKTRQRKEVATDAARAVYLERRKECGQVKSVIEARMSVAAVERSRREQRELDDWFSRRSRSSGAVNQTA